MVESGADILVEHGRLLADDPDGVKLGLQEGPDEETMRALIAGVLLNLNLSIVMEEKALALRRDSLLHLTAATYNTPSAGFAQFLSDTFGEQKDSGSILGSTTSRAQTPLHPSFTEEPPQPRGVDLPFVKGRSHSATSLEASESGPPQGGAVRGYPEEPVASPAASKPEGNDPPDLVPFIVDCKRVFPLSEKTVSQTGVPSEFISPRHHNEWGHGRYYCEYGDCGTYRSSLSSLAAHVRRAHLGIALACPICHDKGIGKVAYTAEAWKHHMKEEHSPSSDNWYRDPEAGDVTTVDVAATLVSQTQIQEPTPLGEDPPQESFEPVDKRPRVS